MIPGLALTLGLMVGGGLPPLDEGWERWRGFGRYGRVVSLAAQNRTVDMVYVHCDEDGNRCKCRHTRSPDEGATWSPLRTCVKPPGGRFADLPGVEIVAQGDTIHLVGEAYPRSKGEGFYSRSDDGGASWTSGHWIGSSVIFPQLTASGEHVHLVWEGLCGGPGGEFGVEYQRSGD